MINEKKLLIIMAVPISLVITMSLFIISIQLYIMIMGLNMYFTLILQDIFFMMNMDFLFTVLLMLMISLKSKVPSAIIYELLSKS